MASEKQEAVDSNGESQQPPSAPNRQAELRMFTTSRSATLLRAIPFEYTWGVERSPIQKSWGEGIKIKKIIGRGVCQILKNMGRGGYLAKKKHRVWGISYIY